MAKGNIQESLGNGKYLVRIYFEADEKTELLAALDQELLLLESDRDDLAADLNAALTKLTQVKQYYYAATGVLLTCMKEHAVQPLNCKEHLDNVTKLATLVTEAAAEVGKHRREYARIKGRIKEVEDSLRYWNEEVNEYEDRIIWSMDYPEWGVEIPGPAEDVLVVPVQGMKKIKGGLYVPIVEYVLHWLTYGVSSNVDYPGLETGREEPPAEKQKQYKTLREKPWTAMSAIQNITAAQRFEDTWNGKWLVGIVSSIHDTYLSVFLEGTSKGGDPDPGHIPPREHACTVRYYSGDIPNVYKVGDRVILVAYKAGSYDVVGFAENPRHGCRWPAIQVDLQSTLKGIYSFPWAVDTSTPLPGSGATCTTLDAESWGDWSTIQYVWPPAYGLVGGGSYETGDWLQVEVLNPRELIHPGSFIVGTEIKQITHPNGTLQIWDYTMEWKTGCGLSGRDSGWYLVEGEDHFSGSPGYATKADAVAAASKWLKPLLVRRNDTGQVVVYDRISDTAYPDDLDKFMFFPSAGHCIPHKYRFWEQFNTKARGV